MFIKMTQGFTVVNGVTYDINSEPFEVDESKGKRFIALKVAEEVNGSENIEPTEEVNGSENIEPTEVDLESLSIQELREKALELGLDVKSTKKSVYIEAIQNVGMEVVDDEDAPTFNAEGAIN